MVTLEKILEYHGNPGKTQMFIWFLIVFSLVHAGLIQNFNVMISYTPKHRCKTPPDSNWTSLYNNSEIYPISEKTNSLDSCSIYNNPSNHSLGKSSCRNGYDYFTKYNEIYPANEFDLVCDSFHWLESTLAISFIGVLIGGLIFGQLADRYGRKIVICFVLTALSILSTSIYFVTSFEAFVAIRFFLGIFNQGVQTVCLTYGTELFLPRMRTLSNSAIGIMWGLMLPTLSLLFYLLINWRLVHLFMGSISLISAIYCWFLPESVPWLVNKYRLDEAFKVLNIFARFNKIQPYESLRDTLQKLADDVIKRNKENNTKTAKWTQLFSTPTMRRITLSLLYIWFTTASVVFGLSFSISALKGNHMYVNYLIGGVLEIAVRVIVTSLYVRYGRVTVMSPVLFSCGILSILGFLVWHYVPEDQHVIQTVAAVVALLGRNFIAVNFTLLIIFTSELMPVSLRSTGVGFGFAAARFGNVVSPYTRFMKLLWIPLPQIVYGLLTIGAGFLILTLPETFNRPMPNTIKDVEELSKKPKKKNKREQNGVDKFKEDDQQLQTLINQAAKDFVVIGNNNNNNVNGVK